MAECAKCFHEKVCKYPDQKVSPETTVRELVDHKCVDYIPADSVEEVKHSFWVELLQDFKITDSLEPVIVVTGYKCARCGRPEVMKEPYCHCGARMEGVGKNDG